jgi:CheY-like chemotaxis protein
MPPDKGPPSVDLKRSAADKAGRAPPARILVVDDDDDTRQALVVALGARGHVVSEASSAKVALDTMRQSCFDVVVTDYDMPGMTGIQMLEAAGRTGLLGSAAVLLVTAHPDPEGVGSMPVLLKPVDFGKLLLQVEGIIPVRAHTLGAPNPPRLDLVLYLGDNAASKRARARLDHLLQALEPGTYELEIRDLDSEAAERDKVVFVPTLLKRAPGPPARIVGDLGKAGVLEDDLQSSGHPRRI